MQKKGLDIIKNFTEVMVMTIVAECEGKVTGIGKRSFDKNAVVIVIKPFKKLTQTEKARIKRSKTQ